MSRSNKTKEIVHGILGFLNEESSKSTSAEKESLEVAMQCIETVYGINLQDIQYKPQVSIREVYGDMPPEGAASQPLSDFTPLSTIDLEVEYELPPEATNESQDAAEDFKNKGNESMKNMKEKEALEYYNKAVKLDGRNSVYFCNRAATHINLEKYDEAIRDCRIAIRLQPNYARAYGRMGVVYSKQKKYVDAILCFKKAIEIDPNTESYANNLQFCQNSLLQDVQRGQAQEETIIPSSIQSVLSNPNLINMATNLLQDPSMQQMMQNLMSGLGQPTSSPGSNPMDYLSQMGQAIANQLRTENQGNWSGLGDPPAPGGNNQ